MCSNTSRISNAVPLRVCVIGAGPTGLVSAKYLLEKDYDVVVYEMETGVGGTFLNKVYDATTLVSSKTITSFSDLRMGEGIEREHNGPVCDHPSAERYVRYLDTYARLNGVTERIQFETKVVNIVKLKRSSRPPSTSKLPAQLRGWVYVVHHTQAPGVARADCDTATAKQQVNTREFDCVIVCSGVHNNPNIPTDVEIPGLEEFREATNTQVIHSSQYRGEATQKATLFGKGKNVLVVGCGETAMDIAYRAVQTEDVAHVGLLARRGFLSIPYQMGSDHPNTDAHVNYEAENDNTKLPRRTATNGDKNGEWHSESAKVAIVDTKSAHMRSTQNTTTNASLESSRPLDVFITNIFEHSYEHPLVHKLQLRWILSTFVIRFGMGLIGSSWGCNQWAGEVEDIKRGHHIINKSSAAMPHINAGVKARQYGMWGRLWEYLWGERGLKPISVYGGKGVGIERIACTGGSNSVSVDFVVDTSTPKMARKFDVRFGDGRLFPEVDTIVFATGYRQYFPFLQDRSITECRTNHDNQHNKDSPKKSETHSGKHRHAAESAFTYRHASGEATLPLLSSKTGLSTHYIVDEDAHPGIAYIGFVRPNVGAIPPMSELQIQWYLQFLEGALDRCPRERYTREDGLPSYVLVGQKYQYGVDYGNYMHRVAEDIGAAPSLSHITYSVFQRQKPLLSRVQSWLRIVFTYCLGQAMIPLFRLQGPYASSKGGWDVVEGELYSVCVRRGFAENVGLLMMSIFFLALNVAFLGVEAILVITGSQRKFEGFARYI